MIYRRMPIEIESPEQMGYQYLDCNLTESSFADALLGDIDLNLHDLALCYANHCGKPELRDLIASDSRVLKPRDFLITAGAAAGLFIISTSLLDAGDHLLVVKPNYATNIETPRAIGANVDFLDLTFEDAFCISEEKIAQKMRPETKMVSLTLPHNPTGSTVTRQQLENIIDVVVSRNAYLLIDETYRELCFQEVLPFAAELSPRVISVSSLSKTYGLPGIRIGWIACRDRGLMEMFLAAKEQIMICNSVVDEEIAYRFLLKKRERLIPILAKIRHHFEIVRDWMISQEHLEWVEPKGGAVCFPRIHSQVQIDLDQFYRLLNRKYKTYVGPGHWFDVDRHYMRIGYGWPDTAQLQRGLLNISRALHESSL
jgi:aspartate/methionine/tyrosine aminotransferase